MDGTEPVERTRGPRDERGHGGSERPLSQLALAGLVVGIGGVAIPCCPLMPMVAVVLGYLAHRRIRLGAKVRGAKIAIAAMLGPASTLAASIAAIAIGGTPAAVLGVLLARRAALPHQRNYAA